MSIKSKLESIFPEPNIHGSRLRESYLKQLLSDSDFESIIQHTSDFQNISIQQRIHCILKDISPQYCLCGNPLRLTPSGYKTKFCSTKCAVKSDEIKMKIKSNTPKVVWTEEMKKRRIENTDFEKRQKTFEANMILNHGVRNPMQIESVKEFVREKNKETAQTALSKRKKTTIERFGVSSVFDLPEVRIKGVETSKTEKTKKKRIETNLDRYGTKTPSENSNIKEKMKDENGLFFPQTEQYKNKRKETNKKRYENNIANNSWWNEHHIQNKMKLGDIANELNMTSTGVRNIQKRYNQQYIKWKQSNQEKRIEELLTSLNVSFLKDTRKIITPKELDFFIPEYNIAIECNGVFWHSFDKQETPKQINKHIEKTKSCELRSILLFQFWETEINNKFEIVSSMITNALKRNENRIFARKCVPRKITSKDAKEFCELNHIQGFASASNHYGLFFEGKLVSYMSFGIPRFNKKYQWELIRFCNKINTSVVGGASKLFQHFAKEVKPRSIISYSDKRYSRGKIYEIFGMEYSHTSGPNYFYMKNGILESRYKYQKQKLKFLLPIYNELLTESENMFLNGFRRLWDCGNDVFITKFE